MLQSPYLHRVRVHVQSFGVMLVDGLAKEIVPAIWAMSTSRKEDMKAEMFAIYALRGLIQ